MSAAAASPMGAVLAEFRSGATSLAMISQRTGLDPALVQLVVDRLVALGYLDREQLNSGCPPDGCGGCAASDVSGDPCASGPQRSSGPVLLKWSTHRPD